MCDKKQTPKKVNLKPLELNKVLLSRQRHGPCVQNYESKADALIMLEVHLRKPDKATLLDINGILEAFFIPRQQNRFQHLSRENWPRLDPSDRYIHSREPRTKINPA